jgi:hypothetical protein
VIFSLNEIESMAKGAARGAGFDWGFAEEAAKAVRWLAERDLPGVESLARLLAHNDGKSYEELAPVSTAGIWHARVGQLCPIASGAALSDRALWFVDEGVVELGPVAQPLLLLPFAANVARVPGTALELCWGDVTVAVMSNGIVCEGRRRELEVDVVRHVHCRKTAAVVDASSVSMRSRAVDADSWRRLDALSRRTFAPASEASRINGAGAGLADND